MKTTNQSLQLYQQYDGNVTYSNTLQSNQVSLQNHFDQYQNNYDQSSDSDQDDNFRRTKNKSAKLYHMNTYTKLDSKISLNMIHACEAKQMTKQPRNKDKSQRATVQQVLDPRTRLILLKLLSNSTFSQINGCLSTGKQANVYHAKDQKGKQFAIKIYKTSILIFKDRERYVEGQFRFRKGHSAKNPRKMVQMWAQKQLRNLKRIQGKIPCPVPLLVKTNVLVMDFIGCQMKAAPKLKDVQASLQEYSDMYLQVILDMRILYQQCKLTHADLSEYNLLYWQKQIFMIDVSQAVQNDHPHSLDFLRRDIVNINDFFKKRGVSTFSIKQVFQFIVSIYIQKQKQKEELQILCDEEHADQDCSFAKIHIPRKLDQISLQKIQKDLQNPVDIHYQKFTGVQIQKQENQIQQEQNDDDKSSQQNQSEQDNTQNNQTSQITDSNLFQQKKKGGDQKYNGLSKLQRKHKVKQQKREKRKEKVPKKVKKQKTKK